jgi:hypothetical protein
MPGGACLESARRLGASNPPLAGTLAANLALGGVEQAVWRRSVRYPGSASGSEPGDGFRGGYNRWVGRKAGVGAPAFVMPRSRSSGVGSRKRQMSRLLLPQAPIPYLPIGQCGDSLSPPTRPGFPAAPMQANPLSDSPDARGGRGSRGSRPRLRASAIRRAGSPARRDRRAGSRSPSASSAG